MSVIMQPERVLTDEYGAAPSFGTVRPVGSPNLKSVLVAGDAAAIAIGFSLSLWLSGFYGDHSWRSSAVMVVAAVVVGLWAIRWQGLFLARVSAIRLVEITGIARASAAMAGGVLLVDRMLHIGIHVKQTIVAALIVFVCLVISRSTYRSWLAAARTRGEHCRKVVLLGADHEARRLVELFNTHPEQGVRVVGIIGDRSAAASTGLLGIWLGGLSNAEQLIEQVDASGVVVLPSGLSAERLNELIRTLHARQIHIHMATGISGIDSRRLRSVPLAHEPLLYIEAVSLGRMQYVVKRVFDVVLAGIALILASPVLIACAIAIKAHDRGPVFFRQQRVGQNGEHFGLIKFRTMSVDAEKQLARLAAENERKGPLFKMIDDPRVTRVGRFLRESSFDELPQLINVLKGQMSLVGPRPALPAEVASFSAALRNRESVLPGITGLWQVEARDNPSFEAYRRLDLFYVENWSITLDLLIIIGTLEQFASRMIGVVRPSKADTQPLGELTAIVDAVR